MEQLTYFISTYGYLAIFILLMPGIFGVPLPDEILLTFVGYLALRGDLQLAPVVAVVAAGLISGLTVDYWVGRAAAGGLIGKARGWFRLRTGSLEGWQERLHRRGGWALFLGNFFPGVRHWLPVAAGVTKYPLESFSQFAYAGAVVWSSLYIGLGYLLGAEAGVWVARLGDHGRGLAGVILVLLLSYWLLRGKWRRRPWTRISGNHPESLVP